jgi:2-oxoisovalerate dehydrogenase E1 component alpha subunit
MDESGVVVDSSLPRELDTTNTFQQLCLSLYTCMIRVQAMDKVLFDAQRQGRLSFYMTSAGEEGASVGSAAGLEVHLVQTRALSNPALQKTAHRHRFRAIS